MIPQVRVVLPAWNHFWVKTSSPVAPWSILSMATNQNRTKPAAMARMAR